MQFKETDLLVQFHSIGIQITQELILEGMKRCSNIPERFCRYAGTYSLCIGIGVAVMLFTS